MSAPFCAEARPAHAAPNYLFVRLATHIDPQSQVPCPRDTYPSIQQTIPCLEFEAACTFRGGPTTSTHLRPRRACQSPSGGSIVAQTRTHTGPRRRIARKDWRDHGARDEMCGTRGKPGLRRVDDGDRDAGVHGGEPEQGVRPHLVGRDRLVQVRKEAPGFEGVSGRLHRVEERQEMTAATAPGAARGRARKGA